MNCNPCSNIAYALVLGPPSANLLPSAIGLAQGSDVLLSGGEVALAGRRRCLRCRKKSWIFQLQFDTAPSGDLGVIPAPLTTLSAKLVFPYGIPFAFCHRGYCSFAARMRRTEARPVSKRRVISALEVRHEGLRAPLPAQPLESTSASESANGPCARSATARIA